MQPKKIVARNLYKIFGTRPNEALQLLKDGWNKERILDEKGLLVGISDVSLEIDEGEIFVIMGLSGSGKSTLARLINRLFEPTSGEVLIDGQDIFKLSTKQIIELRRRDMSMVFQSFALLPNRTALGNVAFGLEIAGMKRKAREKKAVEVLEQMGLAHFAKKYPHELSGGMQQRIGLARALALDPSLMIMDEAFSALDPLKRREMQNMLLQLQKEHRRTIVFVSHDIEEALRIGSRIAIMQDGILIQTGTPQQLITNPINEYVRSFFDTIDTTRFIKAIDICVTSAPPSDALNSICGETILSDVIEHLVLNKKPLLVRNANNEICGYITEKEILKALHGAKQ